MDNLKEITPKDTSKINVDRPMEVDYWTRILDVTKIELRRAVAMVGNSAAKVRHYFKKI